MMYSLVLLFLLFLDKVQGLCGSNIRWAHKVDIDDVYGMWYGVGYAQHSPDFSNKPGEIGCVNLYISDATAEMNDWLVSSYYQRNYTDQNWRFLPSNPPDMPMSGTWPDIRVKRNALLSRIKRSYDDWPLRVLWDADGQTMEQTYVYSPDAKGFWTSEERQPLEFELFLRGAAGAEWYPDDAQRFSQIIRVLKVTPDILCSINHCSETATGGVFSLILRRSPSQIGRREWLDFRLEFLRFDLPPVYRFASVCSSCAHAASLWLVASMVMLKMLCNLLK